MDKSDLEQRIAGRKEFETLRQLAFDFDGVNPAWLDGFARAAREFANQQLGSPDTLVVMSEAEAMRYEARKITFGEYTGTLISEVPIERLTWYADAAVPLQAYLRSDRGQRRIDG